MKTLSLLLTGSLALASAAWASADTFTLSDNLDATFDSTNTPPFVGTGTLEYSAPTALADGTYSYDTLTPALNFTFDDGTVFTQDDLATSSSEIDVEIRGSNFYFTNTSRRGGGDGPQGGSADFIDNGATLTTEPGSPGGVGFIDSGDTDSPLYVLTDVNQELFGNYGVSTAPEPSAVSEMLVAILLLAAVRFSPVYSRLRPSPFRN